MLCRVNVLITSRFLWIPTVNLSVVYSLCITLPAHAKEGSIMNLQPWNLSCISCPLIIDTTTVWFTILGDFFCCNLDIAIYINYQSAGCTCCRIVPKVPDEMLYCVNLSHINFMLENDQAIIMVVIETSNCNQRVQCCTVVETERWSVTHSLVHVIQSVNAEFQASLQE
jgi:hypothetical protein